LPGIATAEACEFGGHRCDIADCVPATRNSISQKAQDFGNARTDSPLLHLRSLAFSDRREIIAVPLQSTACLHFRNDDFGGPP
jgi:hypothetical protein